MIKNKTDFVKYGCKMIDGRYYILVNDKWYKLKKSKISANFSPVHVSDGMSGKMESIGSVSTACTCNPICKERMKNKKMVCNKCYAEAQLEKAKKGFREVILQGLETNYELLTSSVLPRDLLPVFPNTSIFRIESFGDVANVTQAINYTHIAEVNPNVTFAWWTKNLWLLEEAFNICGGKPSNLIVVQSSFFVNKQDQKHRIADKVFTVYTKEYATEHNIEINCGARHCATCRLCYGFNDTVYINELLK